MTTPPSLVRRVYDVAALLALLNLVALAGLIAMLTTTGGVNREKVQAILAVLRGDNIGETPEDQDAPADTATPDGQGAEAAARTAADPVAEASIDVEVFRLESERIKTELDQRLALNNSILLRVMTEHERFAAERKQDAARDEAAREQRQSEGFRKQIAIYQALKPKVAMQNLLGLDEPDDAARILLELDARKAKKIVESAKNPGDVRKMQTILQRIREVAPDRSSDLDNNGA